MNYNEILLAAADAGDLEGIKHAIALGADIHSKDASGISAVLKAVRLNRPDIIEYLLTQASPPADDSDLVDKSGNDFLIWATFFESSDALNYFMQLRRKTISEAQILNAIQYAKNNSKPKMEEELLKYSLSTTQLKPSIRRPAPKFQAEITQDLLRNRSSCIDDGDVLTPSLFAHIHNDSRLTGSHLAGNYFSNTIYYIKAILDYLENQNTDIAIKRRGKLQKNLEPLLNKFGFMIEIEGMMEKGRAKLWSSYANLRLKTKDLWDQKQKSALESQFREEEKKIYQVIAAKILSELQSGAKTATQSVLLPGGWGGMYDEQGHAMTYQFIREVDGSFTFLIGNTGAGVQLHAKKPGAKDKFDTVMAYKIPKDVRFEDMSNFIQELLKAKIKPGYMNCQENPTARDLEQATYDETGEKIYSEVFSKIKQFGGYQFDPTQPIDYCHASTQGQESGTCSMRSLMPLMKNMISKKEEGDFDELLFEIRLQSILDFYRIEANKKNLADSTVQAELRPAVEKLGRYINTLLERPEKSGFKMEFMRAKGALDLLDTIVNDLNRNLRAAKSPFLDASVEKHLETKVNERFKIADPKQKIVTPKLETRKVAMPSVSSSVGTVPSKQEEKKEAERLYLSPMKTDDGLNYLLGSEKILFEMEALDRPQTVVTEIETLYNKILLRGDSFWKELNEKNATEVFETIKIITALYARNAKKVSEIPFPQRMITVLSGLTFAMRAASEISPELVKRFFPYVHTEFDMFLTYSRQDLINFNPNMDAAIEALVKFLSPFYEKKDASFDRWNPRPSYEDFLINESGLASNLTQLIPPDTHKAVEIDPKFALYNILNGSLLDEISKLDADSKVRQDAESVLRNRSVQKLFEKFDVGVEFEEFLNGCKALKDGNFEALIDFGSSTRKKRGKILKAEIDKDKSVPTLKIAPEFNQYPFKLKVTSALPPVTSGLVKRAMGNKEELNAEKIKDSNVLQLNRYRLIKKYLDYDKIQLRDKKALIDLIYTRFEPALRISSTLELFSMHPGLLEHSDCRSLFLLNLFEPGYMERQLRHNPDIAVAIVHFLETELKVHSTGKVLDPTGLFLIKVAIYARRYFKASSKQEQLQNAISRLDTIIAEIPNEIQQLEMFRKKAEQGSEAEALSLAKLKSFYSIFLLSLEPQKDDKPLSAVDAMLILKANLYINNQATPVSSGYEENQEPNLDREISQNLEGNRDKLTKYFNGLTTEKQQQQLTKLLSESGIPDQINTAEPEIIGNFPVYKLRNKTTGDEYQLDLISGRLRGEGFIIKQLPSLFYTREFKDYFGSEARNAKIYWAGGNQVAELIPPTAKGTFRVMLDKSNVLHIQRLSNVNKEWMERIEKLETTDGKQEKLINIPDILLEKGNDIWFTDAKTEPNYIVTDVSGKEIAHISGKNAAEERTIERITPDGKKSGYLLLNLIDKENPPEDPLVKLLMEFEDPQFILFWQTKELDDSPMIIELPRYGLRFAAFGSKLYLMPDKQYYMELPLKANLIPGFNAALILQNVSGKLDERMAILPKQELVLPPKRPGAKELETEGPYYKMFFDKNNTVAYHRMDNHLGANYTWDSASKRGEFKRMNPYNWRFSDSETLFWYKIGKEDRLQSDSPEAMLYLAYLQLSYHEPLKALETLKKYRKSAGLQGDKGEIALLIQIMDGIPAKLQRADSIKAENKARVKDPEVIAVRAFAANIVAEFLQLSSKPLKFGKETLSTDNLDSKGYNEFYTKMRDKETRDFMGNGFVSTLNRILIDYNRSFDNIPEDMRLRPEEEYNAYNFVHSQSPPHVKTFQGALQRRWRFLQAKNVQKEIALLESKREQNPKHFSELEEARLKKLHAWLELNRPYLSSDTEFTTLRAPITPLSHPFLEKRGTIGSYGSPSAEDWQTLTHNLSSHDYHELTPKELLDKGLWIRDEEFLFSFMKLYELAKSPVGDRIAEKQDLNAFLKVMIAAEYERRQVSRKIGSVVPQLGILLYFVLKNPDHYPELYSSQKKQSQNEWLNTLYEAVLQESIDKPDYIVFQGQQKISVPRAHPALKRPIAKLPASLHAVLKPSQKSEEKPSFSLLALFSKREASKSVNVCEEVGLDKFFREINDKDLAESIKPDKDKILIDPKSKKEAFVREEAERYNEEYRLGIAQNELAKRQASIAAQHLTDKKSRLQSLLC